MRVRETTAVSLALLLSVALFAGLVHPLMVYAGIVFLLSGMLGFEKGTGVEILNLRYDHVRGILELVLKNNREHPLTVRSSIRRVHQMVMCDWKISDNERMRYELKMPMMSGSFETLSRCFSLVHEDDCDILMEGGGIKAIRYRPFNSLNVWDSVNVTVNYSSNLGRGMSLNRNLEVKPIVAFCMGVPGIGGTGLGITV